MITSTASFDDDYKYAVYGFDNFNDATGRLMFAGVQRGSLNPVPKAGTDVLMVHTAQEIGLTQNAMPNPWAPPALQAAIASITVANGVAPGTTPAGSEILKATDRIAVSDCATLKIFAINAAVNQGDATITPAGNYCTAAAFQAGASIRKLATVYYYVADNGRGGTSLYRAVGNKDLTALDSVELLEGVEDMQLWFGIDNAGNADRIVDIYKTANDVAGAAPATAAEWESTWNGWDWVPQPGPCPAIFDPALCSHIEYSSIRTVRYSLLMSAGGANLLGEAQQLDYNGQLLTGGVVGGPGDRRLRQVVTSTVGIRSRLN
jgi:hypothetical protein